MPLRMIAIAPYCYVVAMLAQSGDALSGNAGWVGAAANGLVLAWLLLKGLPDQAKATKDLLATKDAQIFKLIESKDNAISALSATYSETLKQSVDSFKQNSELLQQTFSDRNDKALGTFETTVNEERKFSLRWHEENVDRLNRLAGDGKELRHLVANLADALHLRQAVEKKQTDERRARGEGQHFLGPQAPEPKPNEGNQ